MACFFRGPPSPGCDEEQIRGVVEREILILGRMDALHRPNPSCAACQCEINDPASTFVC